MHFLTLPQEIRDMIYACLFTRTRLTWSWYEKSLKPHCYSLAILRTCRRVRYEIGDYWVKMVLFNFNDLDSMYNILTRLPDIAKVRHIRVGCRPMERVAITTTKHDRMFTMQYDVARLLAHFPLLQLNTLTVIGHNIDWEEYESLDKLIQKSNGWKNLHFISANSDILNSCHKYAYSGQQSPPSGWSDIILKRDGGGSGSSVAIHQLKRTPNVLKVKPIDWEPHHHDGLSVDGNPVLITVKRGHGSGCGGAEDPLSVKEGDGWRLSRAAFTKSSKEHDPRETMEDYYSSIDDSVLSYSCD